MFRRTRRKSMLYTLGYVRNYLESMHYSKSQLCFRSSCSCLNAKGYGNASGLSRGLSAVVFPAIMFLTSLIFYLFTESVRNPEN